MRTYPGKEYLRLIDCVGVCEDADLCTAPSLLGLDISNVPEKQRKNLVGELFSLPEVIRELEDTPESWIRNVELVNLWSRKNKYDLHGVNYFRMPDGSLVLGEPKLKLPAEDSLGRIEWQGKLEPAQKVFDEVYAELEAKHGDKRPLWDLSLMRHWGQVPATEKQRQLIARYHPELDTSELTKFDAGQIITRCLAKGSAYEPATSKQKYYLMQRGYEVEGLSKYDAQKLIGRLKS
jgi:hypothetical protein